jgi:hypothetical protein
MRKLNFLIVVLILGIISCRKPLDSNCGFYTDTTSVYSNRPTFLEIRLSGKYCYYLNNLNNKIYVDKSYCSSCM